MEEQPRPTILVVFGITGDLSQRYFLPALAQVCHTAHLPKDFRVIGVSRRDVSVTKVLGKNKKILGNFTELFQMDLDSAGDYKSLKKKLNEISRKVGGRPPVIFYLSIPPAAVLPIVKQLGQA